MKLLLSLSLFLSSLSFAHDAGVLGKITGDELDLSYTDHAMAGHVDGALVYASPLEKEYGISFTHRHDAANFTSTLKKDGKAFLAGKIEHKDADGKVHAANVKVTGYDGKTQTLAGELDGDAFTVALSANKMDGHHFVDPKFEVTLPKTKYSFQLQDGQACPACAAKIVGVVLGMLRLQGHL